jgi:hypothetical protein
METWHDMLQDAVRERNMAERAFLQSDGDYCDYHIYRLHAAEEKVRMVLLLAKRAMGYPSSLQHQLRGAGKSALEQSVAYDLRRDGDE